MASRILAEREKAPFTRRKNFAAFPASAENALKACGRWSSSSFSSALQSHP